MAAEINSDELKQWVYVDERESVLLEEFAKLLTLFSKKSTEEAKDAYSQTKEMLMKNNTLTEDEIYELEDQISALKE